MITKLKYCSGVKRNSKYISLAGNTVQIKTDIQSNSFEFLDIKKQTIVLKKNINIKNDLWVEFWEFFEDRFLMIFL